ALVAQVSGETDAPGHAERVRERSERVWSRPRRPGEHERWPPGRGHSGPRTQQQPEVLVPLARPHVEQVALGQPTLLAEARHLLGRATLDPARDAERDDADLFLRRPQELTMSRF